MGGGSHEQIREIIRIEEGDRNGERRDRKREKLQSEIDQVWYEMYEYTPMNFTYIYIQLKEQWMTGRKTSRVEEGEQAQGKDWNLKKKNYFYGYFYKTFKKERTTSSQTFLKIE